MPVTSSVPIRRRTRQIRSPQRIHPTPPGVVVFCHQSDTVISLRFSLTVSLLVESTM